MALSPLPPWLNVSPEHYLEAARSGGSLGLGIAQQHNQAAQFGAEQLGRLAALDAREREQAASDALRRWEVEQNLQAKAMELAAERERAAATLDEARRYHLDSTALGRSRLAQEIARDTDVADYHKTMAEAAMMRANKVAGKAAGQWTPVPEVPGMPGVSGIQQPSGTFTLVNRPVKEFTPYQRAMLELSAANKMVPAANESAASASYRDRTNRIGQILQRLDQPKALPANPAEAVVRPTQEYQPGEYSRRVRVKDVATGKTGSIPAAQLEEALASKKYALAE